VGGTTELPQRWHAPVVADSNGKHLQLGYKEGEVRRGLIGDEGDRGVGSPKGGNGSGVATKSARGRRSSGEPSRMGGRGRGSVVYASLDGRKLTRRRKGATTALVAF
jgi:hypothetical protein